MTPPTIACPICGQPLRLSVTTNRRGRHALGVACPIDGRHFRGFINHRPFVEEALHRLAEAADERIFEALQSSSPPGRR